MANQHSPKIAQEVSVQLKPDQPLVYQIRLQGHLDLAWATWFEGLIITQQENGDTLLTGPVVDQAALYGLLRKVRDLSLPLISLMHVDPDQLNISDNKRKRIP